MGGWGKQSTSTLTVQFHSICHPLWHVTSCLNFCFVSRGGAAWHWIFLWQFSSGNGWFCKILWHFHRMDSSPGRWDAGQVWHFVEFGRPVTCDRRHEQGRSCQNCLHIQPELNVIFWFEEGSEKEPVDTVIKIVLVCGGLGNSMESTLEI
jgi:hypothetical protein